MRKADWDSAIEIAKKDLQDLENIILKNTPAAMRARLDIAASEPILTPEKVPVLKVSFLPADSSQCGWPNWCSTDWDARLPTVDRAMLPNLGWDTADAI